MINQTVASLVLIYLAEELEEDRISVDTSERRCADLDEKYQTAKCELLAEWRYLHADSDTISELSENYHFLGDCVRESTSIWQMRLVKLGQTTEAYNNLLKVIETDQAEYVRSARK